jgi:hypothetical protein
VIDDKETFKDRALACFIPPIPEQEQAPVWAELQNLATIYQGNLGRGEYLTLHVRYSISYSDGRTEDIDDPPPRRRGRPHEYAAARLVLDLRDLLTKHGCQHGATHDRKNYGSRLVDLAKVVHKMAGERPQGGWRHAAEMANANWEISTRIKVFKWWFSLEHGVGAPPQSLSLADAQMGDLVIRAMFPGMTRFIPLHPWPGYEGLCKAPPSTK